MLLEPRDACIVLVLVVQPDHRHHVGLRELDQQRMLDAAGTSHEANLLTKVTWPFSSAVSRPEYQSFNPDRANDSTAWASSAEGSLRES